ncbi:hypothetical protein OO17_20895 [Rhodopseudomonas palustris]|uniref:Uncharacterized protein n=2 Tax=Nitrobacteraceae TaxID=41294 RepID=A0A0D7EEW7_RHOPL|nr:hypothetical protein OO17_20895 [Rhodopseudomonas palustris]
MAAFIAVAAVGIFGIDTEARIRPALYLVFVGVLVAIVTAMLHDPWIMNLLKWSVLFVCIAWVLVFAFSKLNPQSQGLACFANLLIDCRTTADTVAERANPPPPTPIKTEVAPPAATNYDVFFQFAGAIDRSDVRSVMKKIGDAGWKVEGVDGGGQRTPSAANTAAVRYRDQSDDPTARTLADSLNATKLISRSIKPERNDGVAKGTLEVWISR